MRRSLKQIVSCALACAGLLSTSLSAQADYTADLKGWAGGTGTAVYWHGNQVVTTSNGGALLWTNQNLNNPNLEAYSISGLSVNGSVPSGWPNTNATNFVSFCIEIGQDVYVPSSDTYTLSSLSSAPIGTGGGITPPDVPMGSLAANLISQLWYAHITSVAATSAASAFNSNGNLGAFQLAVWKLVYDQGASLTLASGNLTAANTTERATANNWLAALDTYNSGLGHSGVGSATLRAFTSNSVQDQVVELPGAGPSSSVVPESATVVMWTALGLVGAVIMRRRPR